MFINFFRRLTSPSLQRSFPGELIFYRITGESISAAGWLESTVPLQKLNMARKNVAFESMPQLAHVDFANMFIGGGVLTGGCVQEEIRFSICPELCVAMLVCPCMLKNEAITIVGAQQFSNYKGYCRGLEYSGPCIEPSAPVDNDGTPLIAICAMDALDYRRADNSMKA